MTPEKQSMWVLIILMSYSGSAVTTQEFTSSSNCNTAKYEIEQTLNARIIKTVCVRK